MKSKYFNITENQDGTYCITTQKGVVLERAAKAYEINPKQPIFIKVRHDGGAWCSLFNKRGYALKDTMWVNDVVINDDGSYLVQEYIHDTQWKHYDNGVSKKRFLHKYMACVSVIALTGVVLVMNCWGKDTVEQKKINEPVIEPERNRAKKVLSAPTCKTVLNMEHVHE